MSDQPVLLVRWLIATGQNGSSFIRREVHNLFSVVNRLIFGNFRLCDTFILSTHAIFVCVCMYAVAYPGILFGGFNKFSLGQRTERMVI